MKINKKGAVASFITTFIATIAIALILLVFIFGSGAVKKIANVDSGVAIYSEEGVEINNIFDYMLEYSSLLETKFSLKERVLLDESFKSGVYEK